MPGYEAVDLRFSADGDLIVDEGGAVTDTSISPLLSFKQEIISRILTSRGDWERHPWLGTNASQYIGEPVNEETMESLIYALRHGLTADGLIRDRDLDILWAQLDINAVGILITVEVGVLDLETQGRLEIPFVFDFEDLGVVIFDQQES